MTYIQFSLTIILLHNQEVFWKPIKSSFATYSLIEADQILTWNHQLLIWFLCSIHWINWIQKLKLKIYFFVDILTFLYTLDREDKKTFIPLLKKCFLVVPIQSVQKSCWIFIYTNKKILMFGLFFGFSLSNELNISYLIATV